MIRLHFEKKDTAIWMSHLDLTRCMSRAMRRAQIPVWQTQGFNPHPYMVFSAPLSLGIEGRKELMDIRLNEPVPANQLKERINACLCPGLRIVEVTEGEMDFNQIAAAEYEIQLEGLSAAQWEYFWSAESIPVEKKTKKGTTAVDLKQELQILETNWKEDGWNIRVIAPCGNQKNVNPLLLVQALIENKEQLYRISRCRFFTKTGEEF